MGSHTAQQLSSPGRCAVLDHYQPQPAGPRQEEDLPTVVRTGSPATKQSLNNVKQLTASNDTEQ